jgi:uracil-DNA glycosylase family 4
VTEKGKNIPDGPNALAEDLLQFIRYASGRKLLAPCSVGNSSKVLPGAGKNPAPAQDSLEKVAQEVMACTRCRLHRSRKLAVPGEGPTRADLMIIGEGPGNREDEKGRPFVGEAGQMLTKMIELVLLTPRSSVFITNMVKCHPPGNRDPEPDEVEACRPYLERQTAILKPRCILLLGRVASQAFLGTTEPISRLRGKVFPREGVHVFPTFHPAYLLRTPSDKKLVQEDLLRLRQHLDALGSTRPAEVP